MRNAMTIAAAAAAYAVGQGYRSTPSVLALAAFAVADAGTPAALTRHFPIRGMMGAA